MFRRSQRLICSALCSLMCVAVLFEVPSTAAAASADLQQKVTQIKEAMAKNQQSLARYTWQQQETVSVKGEVKKQDLYQVQLGPSGKPVKVPIAQTSAQTPRPFGPKHRIAENYEAYAQQVASLVQSYVPLNSSKLQQLYAQGNVSLKPGGAPGVIALVISNYEKQGDTVTLSFSKAQNSVLSMQVASYLSSPTDTVTMSVQFAKLPDGTNHVSTVNVNGQSKNLTVVDQNMNYQLRQ